MKKLSYLLSIFVIPCSFALNLNHSLNNYGFLDASLSTGIKAQTSSTGSTTDTPPSTDPALNCKTMEGSTDWKYITCADPKYPLGRVVIASSSVKYSCSNIYPGLQTTCRSGINTTIYKYNPSVPNGCFNPLIWFDNNVRTVTCESSSS